MNYQMKATTWTRYGQRCRYRVLRGNEVRIKSPLI